MGIINQANANKFLGVASLLYAAMFIFATESFMSHYFSSFAVHQRPQMLTWFARGWSFILLAGGLASWTHCNGFGISFYNLASQVLFAFHFLALNFGGIYDDAMFGEHKQMWKYQLVINLIFVTIAYLGWNDANKNGLAASEKTQTEADTAHKSVGGFALHQSNCNKFLGICYFAYALCLTFISQSFFEMYWTESALNFKLFLFFSRGMGLMFFGLGAATFVHSGGDGISYLQLILNPLWLIDFALQVFAGFGADAALWDEHKNMWYLQILLNLVFTVVAYLGYKDSQERKAAEAGASTTLPASAAAL
jgi:hypothetical protein